ncbi:TetR/AcrR family transcriptional regulator [Desulfovibrio aminophilus]|nr:TetR/AcrR family transcriptional regulator [Desulfovibrio aminophilus]MCM0756591.1 TetR/AcrR family transcriptional regulator [Desulfovibrio aminophilus]
MTTKELILNTAKEMIAEVGFHRTTTASLAKQANISEGTIYRHFESKEEILLQILRDLEESYSRFIVQCRDTTDGAYGTIEKVLESHLSFVRENEADIKIVLSTYGILDAAKKSMASLIYRMESFFEDCLRKAKAKDSIQEGVPERQTALILVTLLFGLMRLKLYWPEVEDLAAPAVDFCRRSLIK